jgi:dolichol-phosphate mannosyltransferase
MAIRDIGESVKSIGEVVKYRVYIVIPALNEEGSIEQTLHAIVAACVDLPYQVLIVNDHSTDRTAEIVDAFALKHGNVRRVDNLGPGGFSNALRVGYEAAGDGAIVTMMADLCDDPTSLAPMYEMILEGYDVVCGSRYMPGGGKENEEGWLKGLLSRSVGLSLHRLAGIPTHDVTNAFKMYRSDLLKSTSIEEAGFACSMEITIKAYLKGARIGEVPTTWRGRMAGKSKFSMIKGIRPYLRWYIWMVVLRKHRF